MCGWNYFHQSFIIQLFKKNKIPKKSRGLKSEIPTFVILIKFYCAEQEDIIVKMTW
jgi:hypothetical protein